MSISQYKIDPKLDLVLEKTADVTVEQIWKAYTNPDLLMKWFCPKPWKTVECRMDLKPGGEFFTVMQGPEGQSFPSTGCYLEVVPNQKLIWTSCFLPGYRPIENYDNMPFTAIILLEKVEGGAKYTAIARHKTEADKAQHEQMGFKEGWGAAFDQLVDLAKSL